MLAGETLAPASAYRVEAARTVRELDAAARVRWIVFSEAMQLAPGLLPALREINGFDVLDTTDNFVCYHGDEAVGTIRLLRPNADVARVQSLPLGLPLEIQCRIEDLPPGAAVAELGRAAILREHRGSSAIGRLYRAAYEASRREGLTHWIGFSLTETDVREDADRMLAMLSARGRTAERPSLHARAILDRDDAPCRPFYTDEQRLRADEGDFDGLPLPGIVRFLLGIGLSFNGAPVFEHTFKEYVLPILLPLDDFARSVFGRRYLGRDAAARAEPDASSYPRPHPEVRGEAEPRRGPSASAAIPGGPLRGRRRGTSG